MDIRRRVVEELQQRFDALECKYGECLQKETADTAAVNNDARRKRLDGEAIKLYEAFAGGDITKDVYLREREALETEKICLDRQTAEQSKKVAAVQNQRDVYTLMKRYAAIAPEQLTKNAVEELLERIVVYDAERIEIIWRYEEIYREMTGGSNV